MADTIAIFKLNICHLNKAAISQYGGQANNANLTSRFEFLIRPPF